MKKLSKQQYGIMHCNSSTTHIIYNQILDEIMQSPHLQDIYISFNL